MFEFIIIVAAIVTASVIMTVVGLALLTNKRFMKAYMKWVMKATEEVAEELFVEKEEEL